MKGETFMYMNNDSDLSAYATNDMLMALLQTESHEFRNNAYWADNE